MLPCTSDIDMQQEMAAQHYGGSEGLWQPTGAVIGTPIFVHSAQAFASALPGRPLPEHGTASADVISQTRVVERNLGAANDQLGGSIPATTVDSVSSDQIVDSQSGNWPWHAVNSDASQQQAWQSRAVANVSNQPMLWHCVGCEGSMAAGPEANNQLEGANPQTQAIFPANYQQLLWPVASNMAGFLPPVISQIPSQGFACPSSESAHSGAFIDGHMEPSLQQQQQMGPAAVPAGATEQLWQQSGQLAQMQQAELARSPFAAPLPGPNPLQQLAAQLIQAAQASQAAQSAQSAEAWSVPLPAWRLLQTPRPPRQYVMPELPPRPKKKGLLCTPETNSIGSMCA